MDFITNLLNQILGPVLDFFSLINAQILAFLESMENIIVKTENLLNGVANVPIAGLVLGPVIVPPIVILSVIGALGLTMHQLFVSLGALIDNAKQSPISSVASFAGVVGVGIFAYPVFDKIPQKDQITKAFMIPLEDAKKRIQAEINNLTSLIPEKTESTFPKIIPALPKVIKK